MKKPLLLSTLLALSAYTAAAEDLVVVENLVNNGSIVQSDRAVASGWTSTREVSGVHIWARVFVPTGINFGSNVTAYLVRGIGPGTSADGQQVARTTFRVEAGSSAWRQLFTDLKLPAGSYYVVLSADSAIAWGLTAGGQQKTAAGFTLEAPRSASGLLQPYPPGANYQLNVTAPLGLVVSTDPDYFKPFVQLSNVYESHNGLPFSGAIVHTRPGLPGPYRWVMTGALPEGLKLVGDDKTGALRVEGVVPANAPGADTSVAIALTEQSSGRTLNMNFTVRNRRTTTNLGNTFTWSSSIFSGIAGQRYSEQIMRPYGGTPPYRYSVTGELPTGLSLNPDTGEISGTLTRAASYTFSGTVRDAAGRTSPPAAYTLPVEPAGTIADNRNTGSPTTMIATVGENFDQQLGIGAGVTAFTTHLSNLPPGLTLAPNGRLTGRLTTPGSYIFCVRGLAAGAVTNSYVVRCPTVLALDPRAATFNTLPPALIGVAYNQPPLLSLTGGTRGAFFYEVLDDKGQPVANNVVAPGITLNAQGLLTGTPTAAGTYPVRVRVRDYSSSWPGGTVSDFTVPSPLTVAADASAPAISGVTNGASFGTGGISAGQIITLFGANLGPAELTTLTLTGGRVSTTLAGTRVTVNNIPAPVLYTSASQVSIIVPYGVTSASASITVNYNNRTTAAFVIPVVPSSPALFTRNGSGKGLPAALNQDGSIHGDDNPAAPGSVLVLYGTGEGQTEPGGTDGALATGSTLPKPALPLTVAIGGKNAEVLYAGAAPGLVAGVFQINVKVPEDVATGDMVPVTVISGTNTRSPEGTYINVK